MARDRQFRRMIWPPIGSWPSEKTPSAFFERGNHEQGFRTCEGKKAVQQIGFCAHGAIARIAYLIRPEASATEVESTWPRAILAQAAGEAFGQTVALERLNDKIDEDAGLRRQQRSARVIDGDRPTVAVPLGNETHERTALQIR